MSAKGTLIVALVVVTLSAGALVSAGCGSQLNSTARTAATRRAFVELRLAQDTARIRHDLASRPADLAAATDAYVADVRRARQTIGVDAARASLVSMADEIGSGCPACVRLLLADARQGFG